MQTSIEYVLSMPKPWTHLFEVEMRIRNSSKDKHVECKLPVWRTGRYLILDFAGGIQQFSAVDENGTTLASKKIDKSTWQIEKTPSRKIIVRYKVYANEFNLRTRELNSEHGFVDPLSVFMYVEEYKNAPLSLTISPFGNWHVTTGLHRTGENIYWAPNYEYFGDCPIEIGSQEDFDFSIDGKKHTISMYGKGNWNRDTLISDFTKIMQFYKSFWGSLPYEHCVFIIHCQPNAGGGTEHINSMVMGVRPFIFTDRSAYSGFLGLVLHEAFHLWNVKQFRPKGITPYDFSKENYSEELWIAEGITSYYPSLIMLRMGWNDARSYLKLIEKSVNDDIDKYGNRIQSLSESSFDAWIKYWKRKQNADVAEADYYDKGADVGLLLDLTIRNQSNNTKSLDDVMRDMYHTFPIGRGYTVSDFQKICEKMTGASLSEFFKRYIYGTDPLPWKEILSFAGLDMKEDSIASVPSIGMSIRDENGKVFITSITPLSPAESSGLNVRDEIVAIDDYKARSSDIQSRIKESINGQKMEFTVFRNDKLLRITVTREQYFDTKFNVQKVENPTAMQKKIYESWLGTTW